MEAIFAAVAFGGLFTMWVVIPSFVKRQQSAKAEAQD